MKLLVAAIAMLLLQQHDPMQNMPGMQHMQPKQQPKKAAKKPAKKPTKHEHPMPMPAMPAMEQMHMPPTAPPLVILPPRTSSEIAKIDPAATLRPDDLDAPARQR